MIGRVRFAALVFVASAGTLSAQQPAAAPVVNMVGQRAPDFTLRAVNKDGFLSKPFHLTEHLGETIVLAFFYTARSRG